MGKLPKDSSTTKNLVISTEFSWKCAALYGIQKGFFENGKVEYTISYSDGYRIGVCQYFDLDGNLKSSVTYRNDSTISEQIIDKSGKTIQTKVIKR